jgi:hypothetical protein
MSASIREFPVVNSTLATAIVLTTAAIGSVLSGCATQRVTGPNVMALPAQGEPFEVFQQHEVTCRQYAAAQIGGTSPGQAATANGIAGAAAGTGIGAAAGALLGSASGHAGTGAAIGAGTGLLAGSLLGGASGTKAAESTQNHYDAAYTQCMIAKGERVAPPAAAPPRVVYRPAPPGVIYVPGPAYVAAPPPFYPPPPLPPAMLSSPQPTPPAGTAAQPPGS